MKNKNIYCPKGFFLTVNSPRRRFALYPPACKPYSPTRRLYEPEAGLEAEPEAVNLEPLGCG